MNKKSLSFFLSIILICLFTLHSFPQEEIRVLGIQLPEDDSKTLLFNLQHLEKIAEGFNLKNEPAELELTYLDGSMITELGKNKKGSVKWRGKVHNDMVEVKIDKDKFDGVAERIKASDGMRPGLMVQAFISKKQMSRHQEYGKRTKYLETKTILGSCEITFLISADLHVTLKQPLDVAPGASLKKDISVTLVNKGTVAAENFAVELVLSSDTQFPDGPVAFSETFKEDCLLEDGRAMIDRLEPGKTISVDLPGTLKIPDNTEPGRYYLSAIADPEKKVNETSRVNNRDVRYFLVTAPLPKRISVEIPDTYLEYHPAKFGLTVYAGGVPISGPKEWRKCMLRPHIHQIKHWAWEGYHWEVDTVDRSVWHITGANFCKKGGSAKEVKVNVEVNGGSKVSPPSKFVLNLGATLLTYEPAERKFRLNTVSNQIAYPPFWKCVRLQNHIYQMQHELWKNYYWEVDTFRNKVTKVTGGKLGEQGGGTEEPVNVKVTVE